MSLYVIFDKVAQEAGPVFSAKNDGIALRSCRNIMADVDNLDDYRILCVGSFDNVSCVVVPVVPAREVVAMVEVEEK